jgi:recombination protein RecA
VVKNKVAPPFRQSEFDILYNEGISKEGELIDMGVDHGVVEKSGAWYSYGGDRIGQGRDNVRQFLRENPDIAQAIEQTVRTNVGLPPIDEVAFKPAASIDTADAPEAETAEA